MKRLPLACLLLTGLATPTFAQITVPLSERDTRQEARQLIGKMKTAYQNLQGLTAVVTRTAVGPGDEVDNIDSGKWNVTWSVDKKAGDRIAIDTGLAAAPAGDAIFAGAAGPVKVIYDGKSGVIVGPDKKVYPLDTEGTQTSAVWKAAAEASHLDRALLSLLYGSDPVQDFPAYLQELRIGTPQMTEDGLCDVVVARFSSAQTFTGTQAATTRWTLTLLMGHEDGLLKQVITTGGNLAGREFLRVEKIVSQQKNPRVSGNLFRLPAVTEKPVFGNGQPPAAGK